MVMLATDSRIPTFRLLDDAGTSLGRIVLPIEDRISGFGAGTIYLRRDSPFRQRIRSGRTEQQSPLTEH